jgi:hypothetical protein
LFAGPLPAIEQTASALFETLRPLVYQIRVIDIASGDKTTIGSGFRVGADGLVATNFHVVSLLVHEPRNYRLELIDQHDASTVGTLVAVDVLHDLALLRDARTGGREFALHPPALAQGERIFSMGNPHDLGMTIIEGNYNGPVKSSRFERLLFSGSLNPGMSGGPAFNEGGAIVGVNVATGGDQLSFLVPVKYLEALLTQARNAPPASDLKLAIAAELLRESDAFYRARIADDWRRASFGGVELPRELSPDMKCWGHNIDDDDGEVAYAGFHQHCRSEEYLFLEDDFYTGNFSYDYEWMTTSELNALQFYTAVEKRFKHPAGDNTDNEDHVGEYRCVTDFVALAGAPWKASICLRRYKEYAALQDASLVAVSLAAADRAAVVKMAATGIERKRALELFGKLLAAVTWKG